MLNQKSIYSFLILPFLWFAFGTGINAQNFSDKKSVTQTYKASPETTVEINNKYGKIHVISWDKDSVSITADLNVYSNNLSRLEKVKNSIDFKFTYTKYFISAFTDFGSSSNQFMTELKSLSDAIISGPNQIEINYQVYCPAGINLSLINKFGDIYIDDITGKLKVSLSNGDLKINSTEGEAQIDLSFGSGIINSIKDGQLTVSYSDMKIKDAAKLTIDSKSSNIDIDNADYIKLMSRRDKYFINNIVNFYCNSELSQIEIEKLLCDTDCNMKWGSLSLSDMQKEFCNITLNSEYTDINITLLLGCNYEAEVIYPEGATANFPLNKDKYGFRKEKDNNIKWHATYKSGSGENLPKLKIFASQKSYISILEK
jgi:hypothetical protein